MWLNSQVNENIEIKDSIFSTFLESVFKWLSHCFKKNCDSSSLRGGLGLGCFKL